MNYIMLRNGLYYYNRRVPSEFKDFDPRKIVCIALKTDSRREAIRLASIQNQAIENYWKGLACTGFTHEFSEYEAAIKRARVLGYNYVPNEVIATLPLTEIHSRYQKAEKNNFAQPHTAALLGGVEIPKVRLTDTLKRYFDYSKDKILDKSENQIRKWKNPRSLAMRDFINCVGNKSITQLTREDILKYRDWWIGRIEKDNLSKGTANKNMIAVKAIIETVSENMNLQLDTGYLFRKIIMPSEQGIRLPFTTEFIVSLFNSDRLNNLNLQARCALFSIAETGAGISEQVGLLPENIILAHEIPHIVIAPRKGHRLKTKYRKRIIPLVGFALDAFRACPNGFTEYAGRPDALSNTLSKYLNENNILPSEKHSVYSLRHSFQDRLLAVNAPDRVQADLMGHKFSRQAYGNGASLEQKLEWMEKIQLKSSARSH